MDDYISRKAAMDALVFDYAYAAADLLKEVPKADVAPVRHGEWERIEDDYFCTLTLRCSLCHEEWCFEEDFDVPDSNYNFCPNCGAKMDGGENR